MRLYSQLTIFNPQFSILNSSAFVNILKCHQSDRYDLVIKFYMIKGPSANKHFYFCLSTKFIYFFHFQLGQTFIFVIGAGYIQTIRLNFKQHPFQIQIRRLLTGEVRLKTTQLK